jgi:hypothetical protein
MSPAPTSPTLSPLLESPNPIRFGYWPTAYGLCPLRLAVTSSVELLTVANEI